MNISDIVLSIVILLLPVLMPLGMTIFRLIEQNLPANQQASLKEYANTVVHGIEQISPDDRSGGSKQIQAVSLIQRMFESAGKKVPEEWMIEWAIEACVHQMKLLGPQDPPKPAAPDPVILSTGPLPVPPIAPQAPTA